MTIPNRSRKTAKQNIVDNPTTSGTTAAASCTISAIQHAAAEDTSSEDEVQEVKAKERNVNSVHTLCIPCFLN